MKAVMYGGGNIGRGFIGLLMSESGYEVTFIDVSEPVVAALREKNAYPVRYISGEGNSDVMVTNVTAVNGNDQEAASEAIASCDLMATAVGARILPYIVPNIVAGLRKRWVMGKARAGNVWVTIMSNINVPAVASLSDVSCVIIAEKFVNFSVNTYVRER